MVSIYKGFAAYETKVSPITTRQVVGSPRHLPDLYYPDSYFFRALWQQTGRKI